jgi:outer membrane protein insertion porin family
VNWKRAGLALGFIAVVLGLLAFGLFPQDPVRRILESKLSSALGGPVLMRRVHIVPARLSAEIEGLSVDTPAYRLTAERVVLSSRLHTLTSGAIDLESLQVETPRIEVKPPSVPPRPAASLPGVRIDRLSVTGGSVEIPASGVSIAGLTAAGAIGLDALDLRIERIAWRKPRPAEGRLVSRARVTSALAATLESAVFDATGLHVEAKGALGPLQDPKPDLTVTAQATLPEVLALAPEPALDARGRLAVEAQVRGTLEALVAEAKLTTDGLLLEGWKIDTATATGSYRSDVATVELTARALGGSVTVRGEKRGPNVDGRLSAQNLLLPDVGRVSALVQASGPLEGRLAVRGSATVDGAQDETHYTLRAEGRGGARLPGPNLDIAWTADAQATAPGESAEVRGQGTARGAWPTTAIDGTLEGSASLARAAGPLVVPLSGTLRTKGTTARLDLQAQPGAGQVALGVDLEGSTPRRVTANGQALDLGLLDPRAGGQLSLELDLRDPLTRATGEGRAHAEAITWAGTPLGNADVSLTATGGALDARFDVPELRLTGTATRASLKAPNIAGTLRADKTPMALLGQVGGQSDLEGELSAEATFALPVAQPSQATLQASVTNIAVTKGDYSARTEAPFRVDLDAARARVEGLRVVGHGASLALDGTMALAPTGPLDLRTRFSADLGALPLPEGTTAKGLMAGELVVTGTGRRPSAQGDITLADIAVAGTKLPTLGIAQAKARIDGETLVLPPTELSVATGTVTVEGRLPIAAAVPAARARKDVVAPGEAASLDLHWKDVSVGALLREAAPQASQSVAATASGEAHVEGGLASVREVNGTARLELAEVRMSDLPMTVSPIAFELERGRVEARDVTLSAQNGSLVLGGAVDLGSRKVEGTGKGRIDLRALSPFLPDTSVGGVADVDVTLGGTLDAPQPLGRLDVADASVRSRLFPHALTSLKGSVVFDPAGLKLESVTADLAGGSLVASGGAGIGSAGLEDVNVKLEGRELNLRYPEGLRSRATLDLTLTGRSGALLLAGDIHADRGRYDIDTVLRQSLKGTTIDRSPEPSPLMRSLALDVRVITDTPVVVRHDLINVEASGSVTARGDMETPAPFGRFEIAEGGTIEIQGHEFTVESGTLTYAGTWNPDVSMRLTATIHSIDEQQDYQVAVTASGSLDNPSLTFSSEPATHSEAQVLSLISTGRLDTSGAESVGRLAGNQLAILMTSRLTGGLARGLGLDRVSLQPELLSREKEPGARFTFEKQLARRLRLIQSYSLNDAEARFTQLEADLPKSVKALGQRDDDGVLTAGVGQKLRFGGPKKPKAPPRQRPEELAKVVIQGAPAGLEEALRDRLKVKEGKRAGAGRLQDDAEALRVELVKRGYIEAEVSARAKDAVATFNVRSGPHFSTRVEGAAVPAGLERALLDSLYEDEAVERGKALVLQELRDAGHLRAKVETATERNENERVLVFRADPGTLYTSIVLQFPGATELSENALSKAGGGPGAFLAEPEPALQRVRNAYADALRLAAQAGPVAVQEGPGSVVIVVPIDEGPEATIKALHVEGSSQPEGAIEEVAQLEIGKPYDENEVVASVAKVRDHYLTLGYPAVRVATEVTIAAPDIELTLRIDEGERLTIGPVEIQGATHTRLGLVRGALKFKEGEFLDVRELTKAERRLLELGIFTRASISYARANPAKVTVDLQEQAPVYAAYQVRYNAEDLWSGQIDGERGNLFGRGIALGGRLRLGGNIEEERISFRIPSFFRGDLVTSLFRISEDLPIDETDPDSERNNSLERGFDVQQKIPLTDITNLLFGYRYKRSTLTSPILIEPITVSVATVDSSIVRDSRDFALDASQGQFLSLNVEYSPEALGSDLQFFKTFGQAFFYKQLTTSLVWGQAYRTGLAWTFGGQELIPDERFRAGGATSVRGYATDSLGPRDFLGDPAGGDATFVMNQELRYRHHSGVGGVLFWDAGNVFARVSDLGFDLKHSVGVGLRWASPVGLLRFDIGHALQPEPNTKSWRYYFSFGQSF